MERRRVEDDMFEDGQQLVSMVLPVLEPQPTCMYGWTACAVSTPCSMGMDWQDPLDFDGLIGGHKKCSPVRTSPRGVMSRLSPAFPGSVHTINNSCVWADIMLDGNCAGFARYLRRILLQEIRRKIWKGIMVLLYQHSSSRSFVGNNLAVRTPGNLGGRGWRRTINDYEGIERGRDKSQFLSIHEQLVTILGAQLFWAL